ncbi:MULTISPECIES: SVM family protein [16SrII (Peanut WB group)]|uniref:SVM family protein n=3 Tax=Candidatus Phytoplasma TaxID=33926 RepID=A0AAP4X8Q5_9MOLU|nr:MULTISPECIES: SVM family protein [16SrII (Peanut WB group)]QLL36883.1 putative secreted protein, AYWB SAP55-like ['Echinacea purpurea' witches'-broom phytoplasma]WEX20462.1 MAG: putative secreted protein, SAP55-like [Candidatus Phytoplasma aurantifolia]EMR14765.1 putative effector, AYWB SAP55-like protein [Peanut witches'-broom phytoplasma NTU2011]MDO8054731.1 SVM family protein [Candidatus Phytoplasma australasiaticum]WKV64131.1 MAG: putative secreted protein, AYWB SAP55-like [Candidatus P
MFKLNKQLSLFNIILFIFLGFLFVVNNYKVMAMKNDKNKSFSEVKDEEILFSNDSEVNIDKIYALHEVGHAIVAYELGQRHSLIDIARINLDKQQENLIAGTTTFQADDDHFSLLDQLAFYFGGIEAEKTTNEPLEQIKYRFQHDEKEIKIILKKIIQNKLFLDLYSNANSIEEQKNILKNIAQKMAEEVIIKYRNYLCIIAEELLQKKRMSSFEFKKIINTLINDEQEINQEEINQEFKVQKKSKSICNCIFL